MKRCLLLGFFFLPLVSCNKEVSMDVAYLEGKPVVNAYIAADAPMRVWLSKTRSPMSNQDVAFDDATVIVSEGESDDTLAFDGSSYFSDKVAKAGHEYALKIYSDDTLCAFSYDIIPTDVTDYQVTGFVDSAGINGEGYRYSQFEIVFRDDARQRNFYEIAVELDEFDEYEYRWCSSDDLSAQAEGMESSAAKYFLFCDDLFNGQEKHMKVRYSPSVWSTGGLVGYNHVVVHFRTVSESYYKYRKTISATVAEQDADFWQGMADPTIMFTNINGGYGIFAGYAERIDTIQRIR